MCLLLGVCIQFVGEPEKRRAGILVPTKFLASTVLKHPHSLPLVEEVDPKVMHATGLVQIKCAGQKAAWKVTFLELSS